jgi:hypothetical protein
MNKEENTFNNEVRVKINIVLLHKVISPTVCCSEGDTVVHIGQIESVKNISKSLATFSCVDCVDN